MGMSYLSSILCLQLFLFHSLYCSFAFPSCRNDQSSALLQFKNSLSIKKPFPSSDITSICDNMEIKSYPRTSTWENGTNCCLWDGVTCNTLGNVIGIHLSCSWLQDKLHPNNSLFHLTYLQNLSLALNDFQGSHIPSQFAQLVNLIQLDLSRSNFSGEVPSQISHLHKLVSLDLSWNNDRSDPFKSDYYLSLKPNAWERLVKNLTNIIELDLSGIDMSSIPPSQVLQNLSSSLLSLWLQCAKLQGNLEDDIRFPPRLEVIFLSFNINLTGELPHSIGHLKSLNSMDLSSCQFVGKIPESFWNLTQLRILLLGGNDFSGQISLSFSNLQHLIALNLSSNNFSGEFPWSSLSRLKNLTDLFISDNRFQGHLPKEFDQSPILENLDLSHNLLSGTVPSWCFNLTSLIYLDLSFNQFISQIGEISSSSMQTLDLSHNKLYGLIPRSVFHLENLAFLDLSYNLLQGEHDLTLPISIIFFSVSHNKLTGGISSSICNATSLEILNLSYNNFTGTLPQCIGSFSLALSVLDLQMNRFSGTIPKTFEAASNLRTINLNGNLLEGSIPQSLTNCTKLNVLDLGRNSIEGAFPYWLGTLEELQVLVLRENKLQGPITSFKDKTNYAFQKLRVFDLSNNNLTGPLPTACFQFFKAMMDVLEAKIGLQYLSYQNNSNGNTYQDSIAVTLKGLDIQLEKILTIFTTIDLSNNYFEGEIPEIVGELGSLKGLNLSHNRLTGAIPKSIGNLKNLEWLDLSSNKFTGKIPLELTNLNFLEVLNLSQNQLEGCIPRGKQFETFTSDSFKGNMGLHGFQVSSDCDIDERRMPSSYSKYAFEFEFGWKPVVLGYGCGAIVGAIVGQKLILMGKPQWFVSMVERPPNTRKRRTRNCRR